MQTHRWLYNIGNIYIDDANNNRIQKFVKTTSDQEKSKQCFLPIINYIIIQRKKIWIISLLFVYTLACEEHKKIFWSSWLAAMINIINFCFSLMKRDQLLDYIWRRKCYLQKKLHIFHRMKFNKSLSSMHGCFIFTLLILISTLTAVLIICLTTKRTSMCIIKSIHYLSFLFLARSNMLFIIWTNCKKKSMNSKSQSRPIVIANSGKDNIMILFQNINRIFVNETNKFDDIKIF